jgi:hypothetical protein
MVEALLPSLVLGKASLRGNEYAWPLAAIEEAVVAGWGSGLACLGGQVQFRLPDATCELYCFNADSADRLPGEPWPVYVARSADEVIQGVRRLQRENDLIAEGVRSWPHLAAMHGQGVDIAPFLCFVLYFVSEAAK